MKEHDISERKVLELIKPYYYGYPGEATNKLDGDTSFDSSLEIKTTTMKQGITILLTLQPTEGGDKAKIIVLVNSRAMICCINIDFARRMK